MRRLAVLLVVLLAGCGNDGPLTLPYLDGVNAVALATTSDDRTFYVDDNSAVWSVDKAGQRSGQPVATLQTESTGDIINLVTTKDNRVFAIYLTNQDQLVVTQVDTGRVVWNGPRLDSSQATSGRIGGGVTVNDSGRIVLALGDLGSTTNATDALRGRILTLDPDGSPEQRPNAIAEGFAAPGAVTYDQAGALWVADGDANTNVTVFRVSSSGERGPVTDSQTKGPATGFVSYSEEELALCFDGNRGLQRYLIRNVTETQAGRFLSNDCERGPTSRSDGTLVYATANGLRVTT